MIRSMLFIATCEVVVNQMQFLDRAPKNGNGAKTAEPSKAADPSMRAITPSSSRRARRRTKFLSDGLPATVPTFYFLQDATTLRRDRLGEPPTPTRHFGESQTP